MAKRRKTRTGTKAAWAKAGTRTGTKTRAKTVAPASGPVTLDEANEATRRRISTDDLVVAVVGTHAEIGEAVASAVPGLAKVEVVAYDAE